MGKHFTDTERDEIRTALKNACRIHWKDSGYKKTSIDSLCKEVGISKGAFYLFYESKELLFFEIIQDMQNMIYDVVAREIKMVCGSAGIVNALKKIYRIYHETHFLEQSGTEDYQRLLEKLDSEKRMEILAAEKRNAELFIMNQNLIQSESRVLSVIYSLLMNVKNEAILPDNHLDVFDFMVDQIIPTMYE